MTQPTRIVTDSMAGLRLPDIDVWSERVSTVLGQNPGPFTGPGTNTYLIGTSKRPILLDTGIGLPVYDPLLEKGLQETKGAAELQEIILTHVHADHIGGVARVRERFGDLKISKKPWPNGTATFGSGRLPPGRDAMCPVRLDDGHGTHPSIRVTHSLHAQALSPSRPLHSTPGSTRSRLFNAAFRKGRIEHPVCDFSATVPTHATGAYLDTSGTSLLLTDSSQYQRNDPWCMTRV